MNLGFVVPRLSTRGGTEKYVVDLSRWLIGRGHAVHVYCADAGVDLPGAIVVRLPVAARRGRAGTGAFILASRQIELDRHDVVQGFARSLRHHVYRAGGGVHAAWLRARSSAFGGFLGPLDRLEAWLDRRAMESARIVVFNSAMAADQAVRMYGLRGGRVEVVRNGVDLARFRCEAERRRLAREAWGVPERGRVAAFVGHGFRRKGLAVAAAAFVRVAGPDDRFVVIGRDARAERHLGQIRGWLGSRLVELGPVADPETWIPGADATMLPTLYDAAANTTLEAMACGVPAITSGCDGNAEIVPDPELVVTDPRDVQGFSRALAYAWSSGPEGKARARAAAEAWPVSRNGLAMEQLYVECRDG